MSTLVPFTLYTKCMPRQSLRYRWPVLKSEKCGIVIVEVIENRLGKNTQNRATAEKKNQQSFYNFPKKLNDGHSKTGMIIKFREHQKMCRFRHIFALVFSNEFCPTKTFSDENEINYLPYNWTFRVNDSKRVSVS